MLWITKVIIAPIIATEIDDRVLFEIQLSQQCQYLANLTIDHRYHGGIPFGRLGPILIFVHLPGGVGIGDVEETVWRCNRHVAVERLFLVGADEIQSGFVNNIMGIGFAIAAAMVAFEWNFLAIADDVGWVIAVRMNLIVVAKERIEAMFFRDSGRTASAASPFAKPASGVSHLFQH